MRLVLWRLGYNVLLGLLLPLIGWRLLRRSRSQPEYGRHIGERFGIYPPRLDNQPIIWLHAVSVGETHAAAPLIRKLQRDYPQHRILLTHMTPTGRAASETLFGDDVTRCYLPYDYPFVVRRFLRHFRPVLGILMETEIWINLIHYCHHHDVPLLLANARLSEKSARRYRRFPRLIRATLGELIAVAAQTDADAQRLTALGARNLQITGNLKFDVAPPPEMLAQGEKLRHRFGLKRPVFLAASTRDGEEALLLDALQHSEIPELLTIIVPRHPQRFDTVVALLRQRGVPFIRRSDKQPVSPAISVVVGDSMGEMFAYYAACDIAFIGGSLLPYGGQNLIEPCAVGKPVFLGPHTFNFTAAAQLAIAAGAAISVDSAEAMITQVKQLLQNTPRRAAMSSAGLAFAHQHQGASEKIRRLAAKIINGEIT